LKVAKSLEKVENWDGFPETCGGDQIWVYGIFGLRGAKFSVCPNF